MSGWPLGLALFGCLLTGFGFGLVSVALYARHVWKSKVGQLAGQLTGTAAAATYSGPGHIVPPQGAANPLPPPKYEPPPTGTQSP